MSDFRVTSPPSPVSTQAPSKPIDARWQVRPEAAAPTAPPTPQTYGPQLENNNQVNQYARDDFNQVSFPTRNAEDFEARPLGEGLKERVEQFADDNPVLAGTVLAGVAVAAGEVEVNRNVNVMGLRGKVEFKAEYDDNAHRNDIITGNRHSVGPETSVSIGLRIPLGGN